MFFVGYYIPLRDSCLLFTVFTVSPFYIINHSDETIVLQVKHYVERICFYLERNPNTKLQRKIQQIFPKVIEIFLFRDVNNFFIDCD